MLSSVLQVLVNSFLGVVKLNFFVDELLVLTSAKRVEFKVEIEGVHHLLFLKFLTSIVLLQERMFECIFSRNTLVGIHHKHLADQVEALSTGSRNLIA
jgi:hypothetical protein